MICRRMPPEVLPRRHDDGAGGMIPELADPACRPGSRTPARTMERAP